MKYNQLKILLADEQPVFRIGLKKILEEQFGFRVAGEAESAQQLLEKVDGTAFDLLLMDVTFHDLDGISLLRRMMANYENLSTLVLSASQEAETIVGVLQAGARGYLLKTASPEDLLRALSAVAKGQSYLSPEVSSQLLPRIVKQEPALTGSATTEAVAISPRERQVLRLIYDEYTNPEIAKHLNISRRTVDTHRKNLLHKTGARNTVGLIKFALREKIV